MTEAEQNTDDLSGTAPDEHAVPQLDSSVDAEGNSFDKGADDSLTPDHTDGKHKKHRRGKNKGGKHRRKWKPYNKLSWEERQAIDEKETTRACKKREERFASGHPVAPYNTTQFIMEDRKQASPALERHQRPSAVEGSGSVESSDDYDSPSDDIFLEKEFAETYENFHAERLQGMSKEELVKEYMALEARLEVLEHKTGEDSTQETDRESNHSKTSVREDAAKFPPNPFAQQVLEQEIKRLREENAKLLEENTELKKREKAITDRYL